jgi:hypothetical protein
MLIYCHGFGSSGQAAKAQILRENFPAGMVLAPDLPLEPIAAISTITENIKKVGRNSKAMLVGSSLGGFYALHLHQISGVPAILLNPTVDPIGDTDRRGQLENHFEEDELAAWCDEYTEQLRGLYHPAEEVNPRHLFVFLNRDDEVLDYRKAERYFQVNNCKAKVADRGGHRFERFEELIPAIRAIYANLP